MSFLDQNEFMLNSNIYSPEVIVSSSAQFSEFLNVQIISISSSLMKLSIRVKEQYEAHGDRIKGELLNYILGSSYKYSCKG